MDTFFQKKILIIFKATIYMTLIKYTRNFLNGKRFFFFLKKKGNIYILYDLTDNLSKNNHYYHMQNLMI